ncbi:hypothetical protein, partial [Streptomyces sp. 900105755]
MHAFDAAHLSPAQLDGISCVVCDAQDGAMIPVGVVDGGQVFAHRPCVDEPGIRPALCIAPVDTPADVKALRAFAHQVAHETGRPTVWATDTDHDVTAYEAVYVSGDITTLRGVV